MKLSNEIINTIYSFSTIDKSLSIKKNTKKEKLISQINYFKKLIKNKNNFEFLICIRKVLPLLDIYYTGSSSENKKYIYEIKIKKNDQLHHLKKKTFNENNIFSIIEEIIIFIKNYKVCIDCNIKEGIFNNYNFCLSCFLIKNFK